MPDTKDPVSLVADIQKTMQEMKSDHEAISARLEDAAKASGEEAKAAIAKADEIAKKVEGQANAILEMEQKLADKVHQGKANVETLASVVLSSDEFKAFAGGKSERMRVFANTITGQEGSPPATTDTLVQPDRRPGIVPGAFRNLRVEDALPSSQTSSNQVEFVREAGFVNRAAETAEGVTKPESDITYELIKLPVQAVAHWIKASKQILDDAQGLAAYIDLRMRYGVNLHYETQLVNGTGGNNAISGILDTGNHTLFTPEGGDNALDSINRAIEAVFDREYVATGIMLNHTDWHAIERLKVGGGDDRYIIGDPARMLTPVLWGLPVVVTKSVPAGTLIVGDFAQAYQVRNRQGTVVEMFEQDDKNVQENLLTIRSERRGALESYVPKAVSAGNIVAVGT